MKKHEDFLREYFKAEKALIEAFNDHLDMYAPRKFDITPAEVDKIHVDYGNNISCELLRGLHRYVRSEMYPSELYHSLMEKYLIGLGYRHSPTIY